MENGAGMAINNNCMVILTGRQGLLCQVFDRRADAFAEQVAHVGHCPTSGCRGKPVVTTDETYCGSAR
jgi:hypothetical protein